MAKTGPQEQLLDLDLIKGEQARRSFKQFLRVFWPTLHPATPLVEEWYLDCIADHLENLKEIRNLLINLPPGFCKTTIGSVMFPAWVWLQNPSERILCSSYAMQLSIRDSVNCRRLIESELYRKCYSSIFRLTSDENRKQKFENSKRGGRTATSVGSANLGERATIIIVDDPISVDQARSEAEREKCLAWWSQTMTSRLNDPKAGCRVVIGQRVHEEDLSGFILKTDAKAWTHLCLPMEADRGRKFSFGWVDPRQPGELLSKRYSPEAVASLRSQMGSQGYAALYQQEPASATGEYFKAEWFRYYDGAGENYTLGDRLISKGACWRFATVDLALSKKGDYTVAGLWDVSPTGDLILVHLHRGRIDGTRIIPTLTALDHEYKPSYWAIEKQGFQDFLVQSFRHGGMTVRGLKADTDKITRSIPLQIKMEAGQVWFPKGKPWTMDVELELLKFGPDAAHDDIVDACSYAALEVQKRHRERKEPEKPPELTPQQKLFQAMFGDLILRYPPPASGNAA